MDQKTKSKNLKLSIIIIAVGLAVSIVSCFISGILKKPTITEHTFEYSVTYKLDGETKTIHGGYICRFDGFGQGGIAPCDRYYTGEYTAYGLAEHSYSYTVAQRDGFDLCIVTAFNDAYLMNDTKNEFYDAYLEDPYFVLYDQNGACYENTETLSAFDVEIISWDYPEPIENTFVFAGFSSLYETSMLIMILIGFLVIVACLIFVKKDASVYVALDKIGVMLNFICIFAAFPIITLVSWLIQAFPSGPDWMYQVHLCIPPIILFSIAASISLRRNGFTKSGFFVQFIGPVIFAALAIIEYAM